MYVKIDVSGLDDISFSHHQHPNDYPTVRLDLYQHDSSLGYLTLSREQALELRATLNDWASFYGFGAPPPHPAQEAATMASVWRVIDEWQHMRWLVVDESDNRIADCFGPGAEQRAEQIVADHNDAVTLRARLAASEARVREGD